MAGDCPENRHSIDGAAGVPRPVAPCARAAIDIADPGALLSFAALNALRAEAGTAIDLLGRAGEVRVRLVADPEMAAAHMKFSKIPGTTDVLTFDLGASSAAGGGALDVDILACVDEARRQAASRGHTPERELLLYILHGALHCLGYDDHDERGYQRMHAEEDRILTAIGIGPIFRGTGVPPVEPKPGSESRGTQCCRGTQEKCS